MIHVFKEVLPEKVAENLLLNINSLSEDETPLAYYLLSDGPIYVYNDIYSNTHRRNNDPLLTDSLRNQEFTYRFRRTVGEYKGFLKDFYDEYLQGKLETFIQNNTRYNSVEAQETFLSVYNQGDFLSSHHDGGNGDLAFVLNLTKDWRPEYGGLLHVLQEDGTYTAINPEFNSLVIMELPEGGAAHFVSEVTKHAPRSRIAISGWYAEKKGNFYEPYEQ